MKKLALSLLAVLPLVGGCYAYAPGRPVYAHYRGPRHYYAPRAVIVAPPPRVYW